MKLGSQAVILTVSRLANYGLMLLSPLVLVRLMPVETFGQYREFILYAAILYSLAGFSIYEGLLYFVPSHPLSPWRMVRQAVALTACSSGIVVMALIGLDFAFGGEVVGAYLLPLCIYTLLLVNVDFWEFFFVATRRPALVIRYTAARLGARMIASILAAALVGTVESIIWSLIAVEAVRFVASIIVWRMLDRSAEEPPVPNALRAQFRFSAPTGLTILIGMFRRNLSMVAVAKLLGPVPLAHFAIGKYGEPIVTTLRNSLTAVILPEMVRRHEGNNAESLALWRRATVVNAIILFPVVALVLRFATPLVDVAFGQAYLPAALLMQIYMIIVVRECFDFSPLLRSAGRTAGLVYAGTAGLVAGLIALWILLPRAGIVGAMGAFVISSYVDAAGQAIAACRVRKVGLGELVPWWSVVRTALAALAAGGVVMHSFWISAFGIAGVVLASLCYLIVFVLLIAILRVPEAYLLLNWVRKLGFFSRAELRGH
jgi:O-antigen/teichoic acid export membrane protein